MKKVNEIKTDLDTTLAMMAARIDDIMNKGVAMGSLREWEFLLVMVGEGGDTIRAIGTLGPSEQKALFTQLLKDLEGYDESEGEVIQ